MPVALSYITKDVLSALKALPPFKDVTIWTKDLANTTLKEFTFMNLLVYLVYCRDKTFDMDSMRAFKSLKAYKFFMMVMSTTFGPIFFQSRVHQSFTFVVLCIIRSLAICH